MAGPSPAMTSVKAGEAYCAAPWIAVLIPMDQ
jgi:hypothetical protein